VNRTRSPLPGKFGPRASVGPRAGAGGPAVAGPPAGLVRAAVVARAGWGLGALLAPVAVGRALGLDPADRRAYLLLRLLGARDLGQVLLAATTPPPALVRLGAGVDALHAASMVALAGLSRHYRRPALTAAAIATSWAVASLRDGQWSW
jgi:hypothetical protein